MNLPTPRTPLTVVANGQSINASFHASGDDNFDIIWLDDSNNVGDFVTVYWSEGASGMVELPAAVVRCSVTRATLSPAGEPSIIQRRDSYRAGIVMPVLVSGEVDGESFEVQAQSGDLSEGGISVIIRKFRELKHGEVVLCDFELNGTELSMQGKVVRSTDVYAGRRISIAWTNSDKHAITAIRKAVFDAQVPKR